MLHRSPYDRAQILVSGRNFACGSTREGAVYALADFGIRAVVAPSFGDIFEANCLQNGLLPVALPEAVVKAISTVVEQKPGTTLRIDLPAQTVRAPDGALHRFEIDPVRKDQLLRGLDDIGIRLQQKALIDAFEARYRAQLPWLGRRPG